MKINSICFTYGPYSHVTIWRGNEYFSLTSKIYHPRNMQRFFDAIQERAKRTDLIAHGENYLAVDMHFV